VISYICHHQNSHHYQHSVIPHSSAHFNIMAVTEEITDYCWGVPKAFQAWLYRLLYCTRLKAFCARLPHWASTRKVKTIWIYWNKRQWVAVAW